MKTIYVAYYELIEYITYCIYVATNSTTYSEQTSLKK